MSCTVTFNEAYRFVGKFIYMIVTLTPITYAKLKTLKFNITYKIK